MAATAKYTAENETGCGLVGALFRSRHFRPSETPPRPLPASCNSANVKKPTNDISKIRRARSADTAFLNSSELSKQPTPKLEEKPIIKPCLANPKPSISIHQRRNSESSRSSISSSKSSGLSKVLQAQNLVDIKKLTREATFTSSELSVTVYKPPKSYTNGNIYRSSPGSLGHLGNLRQPVTKNSLNNLHKNGKFCGSGIMGNIVRTSKNETPKLGKMLSGVMSKLDPEALKLMGNEVYKRGRFEEALALYNQAIAIDSNKASCYSNKSAALIGLGRVLEAILACREAIRIEPSYQRAHHRLATLYLRLGDSEKALYHFKESGPKADSKDMARAEALQVHLKKCNQAREEGDWNTLLKESRSAISSIADTAPQFYAMQAEALLKLHRHQEAYDIYQKGPNFDIDSYTQLFGPASAAYLLIIRAQVYMVTGRLEDALTAVQNAAQLDSSNDVNTVVRKTRAMASARSKGNKLFKASNFSGAAVEYSEGLEHDPYNSVLLCNRAACRSKLGQFEKAVEDCSAALNVRPNYSKARLRRADCNAKLERWEAAIQDYEMLIRETPEDEEVLKGLFEAQSKLKGQYREDMKETKSGSNLVLVSTMEGFRHFVTSPGMTVVLFCNKVGHKQVLQLMEEVCKKFPSVKFLKVEIEDHPYLSKLESLSSIPSFNIYKNGSKIKEIPGNNCELLERWVKLYSS